MIFAQIGWVMEEPPVAVRNNERIPIRQVDLIYIKAIRMILDLNRDLNAEAHRDCGLRTRIERLRQMDSQPMPAEIIGEWIPIEQHVLDAESASQIWLGRHYQFVERYACLIGVADRLVRTELMTGIIKQSIDCVLSPRR